MSKYYKAEDVLRLLSDEYYSQGKAGNLTTWESIKSLPTIEVSEDCISREYLEEQYWQTLTPKELINTDVELGINIGIEIMHNVIKEAPSVVPSRAEGEWINKHEWTNGFYERECSICGAMKPQLMHTVKINYCPNCGAKMKG